MKKLLYNLSLAIFCYTFGHAQSPLNVEITGECALASGIYNFNGLVNGKNNYVQTIIDNGESFIIGVGFDGTKWVLYANGDLTDPGFDNIAVPAGLLPPFIGWIRNGCLDGTMIINQSLSDNDITTNTKAIILYPNPCSNAIFIDNKQNSDILFEYKIYDLTGRLISRSISKYNEMILINDLTAGNYLIQIKDKNGLLVTKRFLKN